MTNRIFFFFAVALMLFACSNTDNSESSIVAGLDSNIAENSSSSSEYLSSSSGEQSSDDSSSSSVDSDNSSSSSYNIEYGELVYECQTYKTVKIGTQIWMAENLNYETGVSECYNNNIGSDYCKTYGRLYDWETAMTVCPSGWHLPTNEEWEQLFSFIDGKTEISSPYSSDVSGKYLKAQSGWSSCGASGSNSPYLCEDYYGFAALPGGSRTSGGFFGENFSGINTDGLWWSASESATTSAYVRYMKHYDEFANYLNGTKSSLYSVRCIIDYPESGSNVANNLGDCSEKSSSSISVESSSSGEYSGEYGEFTYGDHTYKTVEIGSQTWMAEDLKYETENSFCYGDSQPGTGVSTVVTDKSRLSCSTYGRLYKWAAAMNLDASCGSSSCSSQIDKPNHQGICPDGWHIPSNAEWDQLYSFVDGQTGTSTPYESPIAGKLLKSTSGWNDLSKGGSGNGENAYGFAALPGGYGFSSGGFGYAGANGSWWSANETGASTAYYRYMLYNSETGKWYADSKLQYYSVRCVKD